MEETKFTNQQKVVLTACFIAYFCAYIGRLNMSASLNGIMDALQVRETEGGTLQTVFAIVYACGQFIFGSIVDRVQPKRMIVFGLIGSAAANASFFFINSFPALRVMWALNGAFQSMLWTPIVRLIAANFEGARRTRASFTMSFTLAAGHIGAWGIAYLMQKYFGWRYSFLIPGFVLLTAAVISIFLMPVVANRSQSGGSKAAQTENKAPIRFLFQTGLVFLLITCVTNGFLRDGVITWAPTILSMEKGAFTLIIPVVNMMGILGGRMLVKMIHSRIRIIGACMVAFCMLPALLLLLFPNGNIVFLAFMLGGMSAVLYGSNTMFTVLMPMEYDKAGRVGLVAGLIDAFIYVGSSLAGTFTGYIRESTGTWQGVYALWAITAVIGLVSGLLSSRGEKEL